NRFYRSSPGMITWPLDADRNFFLVKGVLGSDSETPTCHIRTDSPQDLADIRACRYLFGAGRRPDSLISGQVGQDQPIYNLPGQTGSGRVWRPCGNRWIRSFLGRAYSSSA